MRHLKQLQIGGPAARIHRTTSRLYSAEHGNKDATTPKTVKFGQAPAPADELDLDNLFRFGEQSCGIDPKNKTINTAVGSLPISPLLDPTWRKARKIPKKKQPPPVDKMSRFQKNMKRNPYGKPSEASCAESGKSLTLTLLNSAAAGRASEAMSCNSHASTKAFFTGFRPRDASRNEGTVVDASRLRATL